RLRGELKVEPLRLSFQELKRRHSGLRTAFEMRDGLLQQRVFPAKSYLLQVEDLSGLSTLQQGKKLAALLEEESHYHFDLSKASLFRTRLLRLAPDEYVLQLNLHHIIADGWSVESLLTELSGFYSVFSAGGNKQKEPDLPLQFLDYLHWQQQHESAESREKHLEYWRKKLASTPALALRTDYPRPAEPTGEGAHLRFIVPQKLERSLRELCVREEVTLYHLLLSALSLLLSRYARQEIVSVGSPAANRPHRDLSNVAGVFVNTLVMRNNLSGNPSFGELLKRVKKTAQEAYRHQDLPFDQLVKDLGLGGDLSYSPLFQVLLVVQPFALEESLVSQGLDIEPISLETGSAKFDLGFEFRQQSGELHGTLEYRSDLFAPETAGYLVNHLTELLEQIVKEPQAPIDSISMVPQAERDNLLKLANSEKRCPSPSHTLVQIFERHAEQNSHAVALRHENEQLSYQQLNQRANQMAHGLMNEGVQPGDLVGLSLERSLDVVVAMLAIMKTGAAYVPVDPQSPLKRTQMIFEDANIKALISHSSRKNNLPAIQNCLFIDELDWDKNALENVSYRGSVEDTAYVIYTSGTTGQPKGVIVTHRNVVRLFSETDNLFHFSERDVWTLFHSYGFDFSVWEIWGALLYGGKLVIVPHWVTRSPAQFSALLEEEKVTVLNQTPAAFYSLSKASLAGKTLPCFSLRYVIFGGDALETQKIKPWVKKVGLNKPQLINMYGITETTVHVTYHRVREEDLALNIVPIGRPISDNQLYILDASGNLCPMGVPGEIHVGGAGVSKGYLHRDQLNKQRFIPNLFTDTKGEKLYRSGDLAYYDNEGLLCYLGRIDQQVKVRGYRIELGDIENCLNGFSAELHKQQIKIRSCAVLALKDHSGEKQLLAYVVPDYRGVDKPDDTGFVKAVRIHVSNFLPSFMMPSKYIVIDELPLTINGKVDVSKLKALEQNTVNTSVDARATNDTEKYLVGLWQETLCLKEIGVDDSFFDLGGHSLLAAQILNQLKEKFEVEVPTAEIFQRPTIRQLAKYIDTILAVKKDCQQQQANDEGDRQEFEI
ncbi:MAG: amino acid adenylation domain-containing protein, partial [Pseudomonadales bacterium]|nr:amino acid adenylation domain-containing protein [Pseudomonadales bacterium]